MDLEEEDDGEWMDLAKIANIVPKENTKNSQWIQGTS
jgi:hypothetical protein